jgi:hypothetical protein
MESVTPRQRYSDVELREFDELMCWDNPSRKIKNLFKSFGLYKPKYSFKKLTITVPQSSIKKNTWVFALSGDKAVIPVDRYSRELLSQLGTWHEAREKGAKRLKARKGPPVKLESPLGPVYVPP